MRVAQRVARRLRAGRDDGGLSAPVELAVLAIPLGLLILLLIAAGRVGAARGQVEQAARDAARAASIARTPAAAQQAAQGAVAASVAGSTRSCPTYTLTLDTTGLTVPVGQPGAVTATVTCHVPTGDLVGLPLPGQVAMTSTSVSPVDQFRGRN